MSAESAPNQADTLGDALPREMARVRDEVMPQYQAVRRMSGVTVEPALYLMRASLDAAAKAMAEGDAVAMLRCYNDLKGYTT